MSIQAQSIYPTVSLSRLLLTLENGSRPSGGVGQVRMGVPSLGGEHVSNDGKFNFENIKYVPQEFFERMTRGIIKKYDVLVVKDGATTGKTAFVGNDFPFENAVVNEHVFIVRPDTELLLPEYLFFFLYSVWGQAQIEREIHGGAIGGINQSFAENLEVPLPSLIEQRRIVSILDVSSNLQKYKASTYENIKRLLPSIFRDLFGSPQKWGKTKPLGKLVSFVGGGTPSRSVKKYFTGDIPWATSKDIKSRYLRDAQEHITEEAIENSATNLVPSGSILMVVKSKILMHTLPVGITTKPFCFGQDIKGLVCNPGVVPQFIVASLLAQSSYILSKARGANTEGLTLEILRSILIPDVTSDEQQEFLKRALTFDEIEFNFQETQEKMEFLNRSLYIKAFSGALTNIWRERHRDELQQSNVERDKALGLRGEKPRLIDFEEGRVTSEELEGLRKALGNFAVNLASYHSEMFDGVVQSFEEITKPLTQSLVSMSQNLITPFLESFRQSLQNIQLALPVPPDEEEINRQIDLLPLPQEKRAIHDVLDVTSLRVLKLAHASPAYFTSEDLTFGGITSTHTSASLRVLDSLGFVRLVEIDGVIRYHVIDANTDTALKPDQLQQ